MSDQLSHIIRTRILVRREKLSLANHRRGTFFTHLRPRLVVISPTRLCRTGHVNLDKRYRRCLNSGLRQPSPRPPRFPAVNHRAASIFFLSLRRDPLITVFLSRDERGTSAPTW